MLIPALYILIDGYIENRLRKASNALDRSTIIFTSPDPNASKETETYHEPDQLFEVSPDTNTASDLNLNEPLIALIIDDFGPALNRRVIKGFLDLDINITIAVIPGNEKSVQTERDALSKGKEVIVHMPMEPIDSVYMDERDMIYVGIDSIGLKTLFDRVFSELSGAIGMNNHMGSKATSDKHLMEMIAKELVTRNKYFVDSKTSPGSVGSSFMNSLGADCIESDVFLDFSNDKEVIRKQLYKTIRIGKRRGWAVGIGHCRKKTLKVIKEEIDEIKREGIQFVFVSEMIEYIADKN